MRHRINQGFLARLAFAGRNRVARPVPDGGEPGTAGHRRFTEKEHMTVSGQLLCPFQGIHVAILIVWTMMTSAILAWSGGSVEIAWPFIRIVISPASLL
jgi:hypothetical protein